MQASFKQVISGLLLAALALGTQAETLSGPAPDFTLKSNQGSNLRLEDLRGQVVMLNFWASWCGPCRQEMPLLDELHAKYQDLGFTVLAVNVDENTAEADKFLAAVPVNFPILYDQESKVSALYNVDAMPTTVMIDRDGNQRFLHRGYQPGFEKDYAEQIKQLVRE